MQMYRDGDEPAYGANKEWTEALSDPGFLQMKYLKRLMTKYPYSRAEPDQSVIVSENGERYDRATALRGDDFILVYTYTNQPLEIDMTAIAGEKKDVYWYNPTDGTYEFEGRYPDGTHKFKHEGATGPGNDYVLVITSPLR